MSRGESSQGLAAITFLKDCVARLFVTTGMVLATILVFVARPAHAAGCPLVLDRVIETYPAADHSSSESRHAVSFTVTFLGNVPTFTSVDIAGRWSHAKTLAHQTSFTLEGRQRPFVSEVFTTYDDRTHGSLLDVWVSSVTEADGTYVACKHALPMQRRVDRLFPGEIELVSRDRLSAPTGPEKIAALATPSPAPSAPPTASPQPSPAPEEPSRACPIVNSPVLITTYVRPDYPDIARMQGATGTALVVVTVDEQGIVRVASVYKSSGNAALDNSALTAARRSSYQPAIANCLAVPAQYLFRADFDGR